jgi:hypothetical protein
MNVKKMLLTSALSLQISSAAATPLCDLYGVALKKVAGGEKTELRPLANPDGSGCMAADMQTQRTVNLSFLRSSDPSLIVARRKKGYQSAMGADTKITSEKSLGDNGFFMIASNAGERNVHYVFVGHSNQHWAEISILRGQFDPLVADNDIQQAKQILMLLLKE